MKHIDLEESDAFLCRTTESFWTVTKADCDEAI